MRELQAATICTSRSLLSNRTCGAGAIGGRRRTAPGELRFGSPGARVQVHLAGELLCHAAGGVDMLHVAYCGNGLAMIDLLMGTIDMVMDTVVNGLLFRRSALELSRGAKGHAGTTGVACDGPARPGRP
jgi:hypothetical protein